MLDLKGVFFGLLSVGNLLRGLVRFWGLVFGKSGGQGIWDAKVG